MKPLRNSPLVVAGLAFFSLSLAMQAATYTWNGSGANDNWNTGNNWIGSTAPTATGHILVFSGTNRLNPNNTNVTSLNGLTFAEDAGAFTLKGNAFTLVGDLVNSSANLQTIENQITLNLSAIRTFDTGSGGITLTKTLLINSNTSQIHKTGSGTLTLAGGISASRNFYLFNGKLVLDVPLGSSQGFSNFHLGDSTGISSANQGGQLEIVGSDPEGTSVSAASMNINTGLGKIVLSSTNGGGGVSLAVSGAMAVGSLGALNVDLSSSTGNHFYVNSFGTNGVSPRSGDNSVLLYATVTTLSGGQKLTSFGRANDLGSGNTPRYEIVALSPSAALAQSGNSATQDYSLGNSLALTANAAVNSLTISGSGTLSGAYNISTKAVLMQEGTGNYTISSNAIGLAQAPLYLHQYSTSGTLTVSATLYSGNINATTANNSRLIKTGAGTVVLNGTTNYMQGAADIEEGRVELNGALQTVSSVYVRKDATLTGHGQIGGGIYYTSGSTLSMDPRYSDVHIYEGGTLNGTHTSAKALNISGALTFYSGSTFEVDLGGGSFDALNVTNVTGDTIVTLDGDLKLTLSYAPEVNDQIDLLTSTGGTILGVFSTLNQKAISPDGIFVLGYGDLEYSFQLGYGANAVYLTTLSVVPEPATGVFLLGGAIGMAALWRRRHIVKV